jgi:phosphoribosylformimino-5-aminoimidazole carboxamide ribotide isomerase
MTQTKGLLWNLVIGLWNLFGVWCLEFGISSASISAFLRGGRRMILIPQCYLKNGKVALRSGTVSPIFREDPLQTAKAIKDTGAERLHISDLSVPHLGESPSIAVIKQIRQTIGLKVSVDGAFRTTEMVGNYLEIGLQFIALGPIAYQQPQFLENLCKQFPNQMAVHIDVKGGKVNIPGYLVTTNKSAFDYAEQFLESGVRYILYSDVKADGTMGTENFRNLLEFCKRVPARVICTSDVSNLEDIENIFTLGAPRLEGLVLAKSLYEDRIDLRTAIVMVNDLIIASGNEATLPEL